MYLGCPCLKTGVQKAQRASKLFSLLKGHPGTLFQATKTFLTQFYSLNLTNKYNSINSRGKRNKHCIVFDEAQKTEATDLTSSFKSGSNIQVDSRS